MKEGLKEGRKGWEKEGRPTDLGILVVHDDGDLAQPVLSHSDARGHLIQKGGREEGKKDGGERGRGRREIWMDGEGSVRDRRRVRRGSETDQGELV